MASNPHPLHWSAERLEDWLVARIAELTAAAPGGIDPEAPFTSLNLDSVDVVEIVASLEDLLGCEIESTIAWDYPSIRLLSRYVATLPGRPAAPARPTVQGD